MTRRKKKTTEPVVETPVVEAPAFVEPDHPYVLFIETPYADVAIPRNDVPVVKITFPEPTYQDIPGTEAALAQVQALRDLVTEADGDLGSDLDWLMREIRADIDYELGLIDDEEYFVAPFASSGFEVPSADVSH